MVTYNWNTKGVGYADDAAGYDVIAFARTGALPVDYLGERDTRMRAFEDQGYDYFAGTTGDPNLARVVQYAGMYQVWRHFKVTAQWASSTRSHDGPEALLPMTTQALERLRDMDGTRLSSVAESASPPELREAATQLKQIHEALEAICREGGPDALEPLARALVRPRETTRRPSLTEEQETILTLAQAISHNRLVRYILSRGNAVAERLYAAADSKDEPDSWIKTPSIVLSWQIGNNAGRGEGGHNLSSTVTRTLIDDSLSPGSVRVANEGGQRVLYYHSTDAAKIRSGVRSFARNAEQEPFELTRTVETALRQAKADSVTMSEALHLAAQPATRGRGLNPSAGMRGVRVAPWTRAGDIPTAHASAIAALDEPTVLPVVIERTTDGRYLVSRGNELGVIEARDSAGVLDAVSDAVRRDPTGRTVHLHFRGVSDEQARPFSQVSEFHGGAAGKSVKVRTSVEGPDGNSMKVLGEIRDGKWDVRRAEVRVIESPVPKASALDLEVVVPERLGVRSLRLSVEVKLREGVRATAEFIARVQEAVLEVLRSMLAAGQELDMLLASQRIKHALRLQDESIANVKMRIRTQTGEINVVHNVLEQATALSN
jgi:hypothetical protein